MACNRKFGVSPIDGNSLKSWSDQYTLRRCEIARFDPLAWEVYFDVITLHDLYLELERDGDVSEKSWAGLLLAELNRFCNTINLEDRGTWPEAHQILKNLYKNGNSTRQFELSAIGHAHIDTAWLWPLAETHRKCERTFSSVTAYMRDYPEFKFSCSQAYQYEVIKQRNPDLYERIRQAVKNGPVDCRRRDLDRAGLQHPVGRIALPAISLRPTILPARVWHSLQGILEPRRLWLQRPAPADHAALRHHAIPHAETVLEPFQQAAISHLHVARHRRKRSAGALPAGGHLQRDDGSARIYARYMAAQQHQALQGSRPAHHGIMLYGFGDGGGGPTKPMLEVLKRAGDLQGLPRTQQRSSEEFFDLLEKDITDRPLQIGELYFEYHRGTYTSQALVKRNNRKAEFLLHDLEFVAAISNKPYPRDAINQLWEVLLLNQFHDILPGSSIREVYEDSAAQFRDLFENGEKLFDAIAGRGRMMLNTTSFSRSDVVERDGKLQFLRAFPHAAAIAADPGDRVTIEQKSGTFVLGNKHLTATFKAGGQLVSLMHRPSGRETLAGEGNVFETYDDKPNTWDAWDVDPFHLETMKPAAPAHGARIARSDPLRAELVFEQKIGARSSLRQTVRLDAGARRLEFFCDVEWQENETFLKVAFPIDVRSMNATYEMQFGHVERPTHYNTSFDLARFEVPFHKWFDFSEHGFGCAILNESKYGGSTFGNTMRLSLLRAPRFRIRPAIAARTALRLRCFHTPATGAMPALWQRRTRSMRRCARSPMHHRKASSRPMIRTSSSIQSKKAEDSDDIILRLYECHGAHGVARMKVPAHFTQASFCNVLEEDLEEVEISGGNIDVPYTPHKIISVRLSGSSTHS